MGGQLTFDEIQNMVKNRKPYVDIKQFVETGTYKAHHLYGR